jgi:hypothetical protein
VTTPATDAKSRFLALVPSAVDWEPEESKAVQDAREKRRRSVKSDPDPSSSAEEPAGGRGAERLFPLLSDEQLFFDESGASYLLLRGRLHLLDPKNRELVEELTLLYWNLAGKPLARDAVNTTITLLSAKARQEGNVVELFNRVGEREGVFYIDMGNNRAGEIRPGSWRIRCEGTETILRRMSHQQSHPDPRPGGDPWRFLDFCRLADNVRLLAMVTVITCFIPRIAHPAIHVTGCQGSGKSFWAGLLKILVDRSCVVLSNMPRKPEDLDLLLYRYYCLVLDNLSSLPADICDRLCSFISGGVIEKRTLHTDLETTILKSNSVVVFTSITSLHDRPDMTERTIRLDFERIPKEARRSERKIMADFEEAVPEILGGIFDVLAKAMLIFPTVELPELPRMADFALWGYAIAEALGGRGDEFLRDYTGNATLQTSDLLEHNTFFSSIVQAMERPGPGTLEGTFQEVLSELREIAAPGGNEKAAKMLDKDRTFPHARGFRKHIERLRIPLEDLGIGFRFLERDAMPNKNRGKAWVTFFKREDQEAPVEQESPELYGFDLEKDDVPF